VTWSVDPPAAQGTMMVMGLSGFHWACAGSADGPHINVIAATAARLETKLRLCIASSS
jgi:hypothetical protein